jgi:hypothetical protein
VKKTYEGSAADMRADKAGQRKMDAAGKKKAMPKKKGMMKKKAK